MNRWQRPGGASRTGASHRRRGTACQDASGRCCFRDAAGDPVMVLVVADGHGSAPHSRSAVGSRLACAVALREVERALAPARASRDGELGRWRRWLAQELPRRIVAGWREEVLRHAAGLHEATAAAPGMEPEGQRPRSTLAYGTTLGVLVLTNAWWGHSGVGDWDLVLLPEDGEASLWSSEPEREGWGEATLSLCMEEAERLFAARSGLEPIGPDQAPFALVLSTDGVRKSCASDADHLSLCRHLLALPERRSGREEAPDATGAEAARLEEPEAADLSLEEALDAVSRGGSGDDVSVAIARWGPELSQQGALGPAWPPRASGRPEAIERADTPEERLILQPGGKEPPSFAGELEAKPVAVGAVNAVGGGLLRRSLAVGALALLALAAGGAALLAWRLRLGPFAPEAEAPLLSEARRLEIERQVRRLCGDGATGSPPTDGRPAAADLNREGPASADPGSAASIAAASHPPGSAQPGSTTGNARGRGGPTAAGGPPPGRVAESSDPPALVPPGGDPPPEAARIRARLQQSRSTFQTLANASPQQLRSLIAGTPWQGGEPGNGQRQAPDPLTALIALSRLRPAALVTPGQSPGVAGSIPVCAALPQELRLQWALSGAEPGARRWEDRPHQGLPPQPHSLRGSARPPD